MGKKAKGKDAKARKHGKGRTKALLDRAVVLLPAVLAATSALVTAMDNGKGAKKAKKAKATPGVL